MADRRDFYNGQPVAEGELDAAFAALEEALWNIASDIGLYGIFSGLIAKQNEPLPDLTLDLTSGTGYNLGGKRLRLPVTADPDLSTDENGVPTEVTAAGKERWVSLFIGFDRELADERIDEEAQVVYFVRNEDYQLIVRQGAQANAGLAEKPGLDDDLILLCDVLLTFGQTEILDADINTDRRQAFVVWRANHLGPAEGGDLTFFAAMTNLQQIIEAIDDHIEGAAYHHTADVVDTDTYGWLGGSTVAAQLMEIVDDLASQVDWSSGDTHIGAHGWTSTNGLIGIVTGTIRIQIGTLVELLANHGDGSALEHTLSHILGQNITTGSLTIGGTKLLNYLTNLQQHVLDEDTIRPALRHTASDTLAPGTGTTFMSNLATRPVDVRVEVNESGLDTYYFNGKVTGDGAWSVSDVSVYMVENPIEETWVVSATNNNATETLGVTLRIYY